jgi:mono/diheme cytochrome c family protein
MLVFVAFLLQSMVSRSQSRPSEAGDAKLGATLFTKANCNTCHGTAGQGGAGPRIAPNPLPTAAFVVIVHNGTPGWSLVGGMPAFSSYLSDEDIANIRAYLANIPAPPPVKDLSLLNP